MALLFCMAAAFLLASFPARNGDLWRHLAAGRELAQGTLPLTPGWLYDLLCYVIYAVTGGAGLVIGKALVVVGLAVILLRLSQAGARPWVAALSTTLALLALSMRLLLQPATVSYLLLAATMWQLVDELRLARGERPSEYSSQRPPCAASRFSWLPPWALVLLFVAWVNLDAWFILGLGTVALVWLGRVLDWRGRGALGHLAAFAVLSAACLLNPAHVGAFALPPELAWAGHSGSSAVPVAMRQLTSPFQVAYVTGLGLSPAGLAYFPLLGLGLVSFVLNRRRWQWQRFLPWLGLALLSALQVRAVPFFAVVAGPVLAWNLAEGLRNRGPGTQEDPSLSPVRRSRLGVRTSSLVGAMLGVAFLVCAWPGWLQVPPYEPRRWTVETAPSLELGAAATERWHRERKLGPDMRGLHLSTESAAAFAWFCPKERTLVDDRLARGILGKAEDADDLEEQLRSAGVHHVIVYDTDRDRLEEALSHLLANPGRWALLHEEGDLAIFGWRDPLQAGKADPFLGWQLDLDRLAFHPEKEKRAPREASQREPELRHWWEAFWKPAPLRAVERDEARLHLIHAEALRRTAPPRHQVAWQAGQMSNLVGAAAGWQLPGGLLDADIRLTLLQPRPSPEGPGGRPTRILDPAALEYRRRFFWQRGDTPPALLYLAIRAARRALAVNPADAQAWSELGESYLRLLRDTQEHTWGPRVQELRRVQACEALNQAVALKADLAEAHLHLAVLYRDLGYVDLELKHYRTFHELSHRAGPPAGVEAEKFHQQDAEDEEDVRRLAEAVAEQETEYATKSVGLKVLDRVQLALHNKLALRARDQLLETDFVAFGPAGVELELELLLRTGRAKDVREWTSTDKPDQKVALKPDLLHWLRAQAFAASGDYTRAQEEMAGLGPPERQPEQLGPREMIAAMVGQIVLDSQPGGELLAPRPWRPRPDPPMRSRILPLADILRDEADANVLRGLLALEQGNVDDAEVAFRLALSLWKDEATAGSGGGLDFDGRSMAQTCLKWLE